MLLAGQGALCGACGGQRGTLTRAASACHARARTRRRSLPVRADGSSELNLSTVGSILSVPAAEWDACAAGGAAAAGGTNPFVSHGFLRALEESGSVAPAKGWGVQHLLARDGAGQLNGVVPLYVKGHSYGEFVFDQSWASAYARYGERYYPKLQCCVPFTPVTGPRLLVRDGAPADTASNLAHGVAAVADSLQVSSAHVTFPTEAEAELLVGQGWLKRSGIQYWWRNNGYSSFADFEAALTQKRRKTVRQERKKAREGLRLLRLRGADITARHWDAFYEFYTDTAQKKWGTAYLTRDFFDALGGAVGDAVMLMVAEEDEPGGGGEIVAGALNLVGSDALFGRNWGCRSERPFLHMELCYYQAIEEAIATKLGRVEAGAQGEHKMQRGYVATPTFSAHYIRSPEFRVPIADFLKREAREMAMVVAELREASPYKADAPGGGGPE